MIHWTPTPSEYTRQTIVNKVVSSVLIHVVVHWLFADNWK